MRKQGALQRKCLRMGRERRTSAAVERQRPAHGSQSFPGFCGIFCTFFKFNSQLRNRFLKNYHGLLVRLKLSLLINCPPKTTP